MNVVEANASLSLFDKNLLEWGALGFGLIIGWFVYYINRYRKGDVQFGDITTVLAAIGGAAVVQLFGQGTGMFGAYGIGLAIGFFAYFLILVVLVNLSPNFDADWFLDGRRRNPGLDFGYGKEERPAFTISPAQPGFHGTNPGASPMRSVAVPTPTDSSTLSDTIVKACMDQWPGAKGSGNGFVTAVAAEVGVGLQGTADEIIDTISADPVWTVLRDGVAANAAAEKGKLVVGGLKSSDFTTPRGEGHVVVVVPGAMNPAGWAPAAYWGSADTNIREKGGRGAPLSLCFSLEEGHSEKFVYGFRDW